ncbi:MAG: FtsX-like permease family protein [Thermoanaerobaculia bacterium]
MLRVALRMLVGDRAKYAGLLFGVTFTAFLVTFAASFFCGFMTQGFALIAENPGVDVWVMDPAVASVELTTNLPDGALERVRSVEGVQAALPLALGQAEARFAGGQFQSFQVIGVDDPTLAGAPAFEEGEATLLRGLDAAVVDPGGTSGKLETPLLAADQWAPGAPHLAAPTRPLGAGDELSVNDHRVRIVGRSQTLARFPPRPLLYMTFSNARRILLPARDRMTFVLVAAAKGEVPAELAARIAARTGLRARTASDFAADTVRWYLENSEDVGDVGAMLSLAITVGFGMAAVMLYMFTSENLRQYAVLAAMGATPKLMLQMICVQAGWCALLGTGLGLGLCAVVGRMAEAFGFPFRMMWFTPLVGGLAVLLVSLVAAAISARPVLKLQPMVIFSGR